MCFLFVSEECTSRQRPLKLIMMVEYYLMKNAVCLQNDENVILLLFGKRLELWNMRDVKIGVCRYVSCMSLSKGVPSPFLLLTPSSTSRLTYHILNPNDGCLYLEGIEFIKSQKAHNDFSQHSLTVKTPRKPYCNACSILHETAYIAQNVVPFNKYIATIIRTTNPHSE